MKRPRRTRDVTSYKNEGPKSIFNIGNATTTRLYANSCTMESMGTLYGGTAVAIIISPGHLFFLLCP